MSMMSKAIAAAVALSALAVGGTARADVLTFDGPVCTSNGSDYTNCSNGGRINQGVGDTAVVDVQYRANANDAADAANALFFWRDDYVGLTRVAYGANGQNGASIFFAPTAGNQVTLNSFSLSGYIFQRTTRYSIVNGLGTVLFSSGPITVGANGLPSTFLVNLTSANGIGILFGPDSFNVGIDNVDFTVSAIPGMGGIPEPATWGFMILGFGVVGGALRSRRGKFVRRTLTA